MEKLKNLTIKNQPEKIKFEEKGGNLVSSLEEKMEMLKRKEIN